MRAEDVPMTAAAFGRLLRWAADTAGIAEVEAMAARLATLGMQPSAVVSSILVPLLPVWSARTRM
jgi:hypothetical protein